LQQAVDAYFAERQKAEGFTGISVLVTSLSAEKLALHITSGSTSLQDDQPSSDSQLALRMSGGCSRGSAPLAKVRDLIGFEGDVDVLQCLP